MAALERMLASRYLSLPAPRSWRLHLLTLLFALQALAMHLGGLWMTRHRAELLMTDTSWRLVVQWGRPASLLALVLVGFFVLLVRRLTIFSTISTYALFLGTGAMVVVLSVMSGFEKDLKLKILGANAHIVVSAPDRPFTDYHAIAPMLRQAPDVVAVTPFLSNEVIVSSPSNLSGVVLKGIDPATVGSVTDLQRNIEEGTLNFLEHPEKLDELGVSAPRLEPPGEEEQRAAREQGGLGAAAGPSAPEEPRAAGKPGAKDSGLPPPPPADTAADTPARRKVLPALIIGRELAKTLHAYLGDEVNLVSPMGDIGPTGPIPRSRPFRVGGIFYSGMYEYDSKYVYLALPAAQKFLGLDDEITGFELKVRDADETAEPVEQLSRRLGAGFEVRPWQELNRHLFSALKVEQLAMFIVLCFVILVASFSIVANGIMLVREKGREIAILKSMGIRDQAVLRTFLFMGLFMGGVGTLVGVASGVGTSILLRRFSLEINSDVFYISTLPVELNPYEITAIAAAALGIALLAILYPALLAARLRPVEGLRYDRN